MVNSSSQASSKPREPAADNLRILLVDDQKFVRRKLQQMLSAEANLQIVGTANDGEIAIAMVESLKPNVVLIDIEMPKMDGIEATKIIAQRFPECKILILSNHEQSEYVQKIIAAGADGYILKTTLTEDLVLAIQSVCKGYSHFGSQLFKKVRLADDVDDSSQIEQPDLAKPSHPTNNQSAVTQSLGARRAEDLFPPASKWLTWGGISVVGAVILAVPASAMFKYKTIVKAQAIARPVGELHLVQSAVEGQVAEILVKEGQEVKQGQAIATIDRSRVQTRQNQLNTAIEQQKLQLDRLNSQIASISRQIIAETERHRSEIAAAKSELADSKRNYQNKNAEVTTQVEESQAQVRAVEATLNAARAKYNRYKSVAQDGAISQELLAEARLEVKRQQQELEATKAQLKRANAALDPSTAEIKISQERIEQAKKSGRAAIANLNREKEALIQQRLEIEKQLAQDTEEFNQIEKELERTKIRSTATGTVFQLDLRNRQQMVQPGQEVARIIPENFDIEMKARVLPQDISKLKVGQEVQMKVSACPYPDYGILQGKVRQIAQDTNTEEVQSQDGNSNSTNEQSNSFYEVLIAPNSNTFGNDSNQCVLQLGMESQASIISRKETLLQFLFRKARITTNI